MCDGQGVTPGQSRCNISHKCARLPKAPSVSRNRSEDSDPFIPLAAYKLSDGEELGALVQRPESAVKCDA